MNNVKIYKASAGSGKTFTLVYQYLYYMFESQKFFINNNTGWESNIHRKILAVTFTNKATIEMKNKILDALYSLSIGNADVALYIEWLKRDIIVTKDVEWSSKLTEVASRLLTEILNDYTSFRVMTIDGFFQQVVRAFANDFNLNANYKVELDNKSLLENAVDDLLGSLDEKENRDILKWITDYVESRVNEDSGWNPRNEIIDLGNKLINERNKSKNSNSDKNAQNIDSTISEYKYRCEEIKQKYESTLNKCCEGATRIVQQYNLEIDSKEFKHNCGIVRFEYGNLSKNDFLLTSTLIKSIENSVDTPTEIFFTKKKKEQAKKGGQDITLSYDEMLSLSSSLIPYLTTLVEYCTNNSEHRRQYMTAQFILKNIYILGIMGRVEQRLETICKETDTILIDRTSTLLQKIIDGSDTPFIYERVGLRTDHFMIDEFQDTSYEQWQNFVPLIKESVSNGHSNFIVGDIKQSIYRWRNGDWRILHSGVKNIFGDEVDEKSLDVNYRSMGNVVRFNNMIFTAIPLMLDEKFGNDDEHSSLSTFAFKDVYSTARQKNSKNNNDCGYVRCTFNTKPRKDELIQSSIADVVCQIKRLGSYNGVAILARVNNDLRLVAQALVEANIPFCSNDALCVADNVAVRFIIAMMYYVSRPYEELYRINLLNAFLLLFNEKPLSENEYRYITNINSDEWLTEISQDILLPKIISDSTIDYDTLNSFVHQIATLRFLPLGRIVANIVNIFQLDRVGNGNNASYIQSFEDELHKFMFQNRADIIDFLTYWDSKGVKVFLPISDTANKVILSTIHKSKGLEYHTVFLPFVDFKFGLPDKSSEIFVPIPDIDKTGSVTSYNNNLLVPIDLHSGNKLSNTYFQKYINEEEFSCSLDNLNVFYVATTRAKCNLFINFIKKATNDSSIDKEEDVVKSNYLYDFVRDIVSNCATDNKDNLAMTPIVHSSNASSSDNINSEDNTQNGNTIEEYEYGKLVKPLTIENGENADECIVPSESVVYSQGLRGQLKLRFSKTDSGNDATLAQRRYGSKMHHIISQIYHLPNQKSEREDQINTIILRASSDGIIAADEINDTKSVICHLFESDNILSLFSENYQVINEGEIWDSESCKVYRPDRLMIDKSTNSAIVVDYKFGERSNDNHSRYCSQVRNYLKLIEQMGYTKQVGYLLYVKSAELVEV